LKICLVKAGKFFIGIEDSIIDLTLSVENLKKEDISKACSIFFLESFFTQQDLDLSCSEIILLKKNGKDPNHLAIMVNKTLGRINFSGRFEPYPSLYPELATKCCPKIFIYKDRIILLLDPRQLNNIQKRLRTDHGLITLNELLSAKAEPEMNNETICAIVSYTFDKYINFDSHEKKTVSVGELPHELIKQKGLSREAIQEIIDKTILQCDRTKRQTMRNMIQAKLNEIDS
jgi:hypothetical protein